MVAAAEPPILLPKTEQPLRLQSGCKWYATSQDLAWGQKKDWQTDLQPRVILLAAAVTVETAAFSPAAAEVILRTADVVETSAAVAVVAIAAKAATDANTTLLFMAVAVVAYLATVVAPPW